MEFHDYLEVMPAPVVSVTDRNSLKRAIVAWIDANANMPMGAVHVNRVHTKSAARYGTSVAELLNELNDERLIALIPCKKTKANYVISMNVMTGFPEATVAELRTELKREPKTHEVSQRMDEQLQAGIALAQKK